MDFPQLRHGVLLLALVAEQTRYSASAVSERDHAGRAAPCSEDHERHSAGPVGPACERPALACLPLST